MSHASAPALDTEHVLDRRKEIYDRVHTMRCEFDKLLSNWEADGTRDSDEAFFRRLLAHIHANWLLELGESELKPPTTPHNPSSINADKYLSENEQALVYEEEGEEEVLETGNNGGEGHNKNFMYQPINLTRLIEAQKTMETTGNFQLPFGILGNDA